MAESTILDVTNGTTSAQIGAAFAYGRPRSLTAPVQFDCDAASSVTAVVVGLVGSRTGLTGSWVPLLSVRAGDSTGTVAQTHSIAATAGTSSFDALLTESARDWPAIAISYASTGANFHAGDRLRLWSESV